MQTISTLAPYVRNVHLEDYRLEPHPEGVGGRIVGAPLGDGLLDVNAVLAVLRGHDRGDLGVIIEQWCPLGSDEETTIRMETKWREQSFLFASQRLNASNSGVQPSCGVVSFLCMQLNAAIRRALAGWLILMSH